MTSMSPSDIFISLIPLACIILVAVLAFFIWWGLTSLYERGWHSGFDAAEKSIEHSGELSMNARSLERPQQKH